MRSSRDFLLKSLAKPSPSRPISSERIDFWNASLIVLADAHDFADGAHLGAQAVFGALEFFKGPAGELDDDIVSPGRVFFESSFAPVGNFVQRKAAGEQGRNQGDREAGRLGCKRRGARGSRIDFNHYDAPGFGIMRKLDVGSADDADGIDDGVGIFLKFLPAAWDRSSAWARSKRNRRCERPWRRCFR